MKRAFRILLRLYPASYRDLLGEEMFSVFEQAAQEQRARGCLAFTRFALAEVFGLLLGSAGAWRRYRATERALDLRNMRPPEVSKASYCTAVDEVLAARQLVAVNLGLMQEAISRHEFVQARFYSDEERKAREHLRSVRRKYRIPE